MKMRPIVMGIVAGVLLMGTSTASFADEKEGRIAQRKENQQRRIGNGVKNGSLTPHETANLEHKESNINKEVRTERKQNGGNLTNKEKAQVNRQQNRVSKDIYQDKHNGQNQQP